MKRLQKIIKNSQEYNLITDDDLRIVSDNIDVIADALNNVEIPTKVSELENDSGFLTDISDKVNKSGDTVTGLLKLTKATVNLNNPVDAPLYVGGNNVGANLVSIVSLGGVAIGDDSVNRSEYLSLKRNINNHKVHGRVLLYNNALFVFTLNEATSNSTQIEQMLFAFGRNFTNDTLNWGTVEDKVKGELKHIAFLEDLTDYATKQYVDDQIGDIETILTNIIGHDSGETTAT